MVRLITLTRAWRWLQLEGMGPCGSVQERVTNGTFPHPQTRARVRSWPPQPKTNTAACSATWLKTSAIVRSIAVPARGKSTFACAATGFTIALHAGKRAGTKFRTKAGWQPGLHLFPHSTFPREGTTSSRAAKRFWWVSVTVNTNAGRIPAR